MFEKSSGIKDFSSMPFESSNLFVKTLMGLNSKYLIESEPSRKTTTTHNQLTKITDKFTHKHINNYTLTCLYLHKSPITFVRFTFWETL